MIPLETFFDVVMPFVPNAPEYAARDAIRRACIDLCNRSTIIRQPLDPIPVLANVSVYDLDLECCSKVVARVVEASIGTVTLEPQSPYQLAKILGGDWRTQEGQAQAYTNDRLDQITIARFYDKSQPDPMMIFVATKPARDATEVDEYIYDHFAETVGYGARAILHDTMAQPYYNPTVAADMRNRFNVGVGRATIEANRGQAPTQTVFRPPFFW